MQRLRFSILASVMLAAATIAASGMAKDESNGPPPPEGGPQGGQHGPRGAGGPGAGGFHLLPRFVADDLKLTDDQKKQVADLEKDTKAKLYKILTADQKKTLEKARGPRMGPGGPGSGGQGRGRRGPGRGNGGPDGGPDGGSDSSGGSGGGGPKPDRT